MPDEPRDLPKATSPEPSDPVPAQNEEDDEVYAISGRLVRHHFSSPYPPPEVLKQYGEIVPGLAEKLIALVDAENKHRRALEVKQADAEIEDQRAGRRERGRGQWLGFGIGTIAIVAGAVTSILGAPWPGGFIGAGGVVALVAVFVLGRILPERYTSAPDPEADHRS